MPVKKYNTRIKQKSDSVGNFSLAPGGSSAFVPMLGEIVVGWENTSSNTASSPFVMKVGDGSSSWTSLPEIGTESFSHTSCNSSTASGSDTTVISANFGSYKKNMATYEVAASDKYRFTLSVSVADGKLASAEHCFLIDNSDSSFDREFTGISISGVSQANMRVQTGWLSAGDTMLISIRVYYVGSTPHAVVTTETGFVNAGILS